MSSVIVPLKAGANPVAAIIPGSFEDVQRMAKMAVAAGLAPRAYNDEDDTAVAKATAAIMHGLECGVPPMQAMQNIAVINGRTVMWGELLVAVLLSHGFKVKMWVDGDGDARCGRARLTRPDGEVTETFFSVKQAKQARLWDERDRVRKKGKNGEYYDAPNDSAWFRFPDDMLEWKALGRANRRGGSDATRGLMIRQDMDEPPEMRDVTPAPTSSKPNRSVPAPELPDIPDVPDIPDDPPADQSAVLRDLERRLDAAPENARQIEKEFASAIMAMDDDGREAAVEMIQAAKSQPIAAE